jgi:hypothetical protein
VPTVAQGTTNVAGTVSVSGTTSVSGSVAVTNPPTQPVNTAVLNAVTVIGPAESPFSKPQPPVQAVILNDASTPIPTTTTIAGPLAVREAAPSTVTLIANASATTPTQQSTGVSSLLFSCWSDSSLNNSQGLFAVPSGMKLVVESIHLRATILNNAFSFITNMRLVDVPASGANLLTIHMQATTPNGGTQANPLEYVMQGALHAYIPAGDTLQIQYDFRAGDQQTAADAILYGRLVPAQ